MGILNFGLCIRVIHLYQQHNVSKKLSETYYEQMEESQKQPANKKRLDNNFNTERNGDGFIKQSSENPAEQDVEMLNDHSSIAHSSSSSSYSNSSSGVEGQNIKNPRQRNIGIRYNEAGETSDFEYSTQV